MTAHRSTSGTIYLIHFERPLAHARHYLGFALDLNVRLDQHLAGNGSKLLRAVRAAGIPWTVARTWQGDRAFERKLHNRHETPRLCPVCRASRPRRPNPDPIPF